MNVNIIGVPLFYGCDKQGVELGPNKLREKGLKNVLSDNHNVYDLGNLFVPKISIDDKFNSHPKMKYLEEVVDVNSNLAQIVYSSLVSESFPLVLGGDHSLALGSISGTSKFCKDLAVIWVDAHGDVNTEDTSPTGNIHGMPLAAAIGIGNYKLTNIFYEGSKVKPENVFIIGARSLDLGEVSLIKNYNINLYSTEDVITKGIHCIINEILNTIKERNIKNLHLSFDIDCLDPLHVPGTGTPVESGMTIEDAKYLLKTIASSTILKSMDIVELNTAFDNNDITTDLTIELLDLTFKYLN